MKISRTVRLLGIIILPSSRSTAWFADGIQNLNQRWKVCIDVGGEYFEKEMKDFFLKTYIQCNLVISNSLISNHRLSRSENLVPVLK